MPQETSSAGFLTFTLHAHLPYVVNHGTWPHGLEWLHEAATETYLPLLRVFDRLLTDGIPFGCNLNLSPILLEQLAHPTFRAEFPNYLQRKITAAREDESFFTSIGDHHLAVTAQQWHGFFTETLRHFESLEGDILSAFRYFQEQGVIDIITCAATHGYMPLLGTDESVRAQVRTAVDTHIRHIGVPPRGVWAPECGYRPAGVWHYPVDCPDGTPLGPAFERIGVEQAFAESDLSFFFVDTHLVEESAQGGSPYAPPRSRRKAAAISTAEERSIYLPHHVASPSTFCTTVFARDPQTGMQVWSGDTGYPGDPMYLDFHKKRWPGGHRYWKITGPGVDMGDKQYYYPDNATDRTRAHAEHFVGLVRQTLAAQPRSAAPPILCSPFDAELFGHWWYEGPQWLEAVARLLAADPGGPQLISCAEYLTRYPARDTISMHEGSWGAEGTNHVWLNPETSWTYQHIYPAERTLRQICSAPLWQQDADAGRVVRQLCRELLLLESSDWQFLITTGAARDYAEQRFHTHLDQFQRLREAYLSVESGQALTDEQREQLESIEQRDDIFPDIQPGYWATGARASAPDTAIP